MARISGVELQENWKLGYALTRIKGIGWTLSKKVMADLDLKDTMRVKDLTPEELNKIQAKVEEYPIEGELLRIVRANVTRLKQIVSYRGMRHSRGLPSRGQRTKTNARTKRGKRKTVGAFKKEMLAKQTTAAAQK